MNTDNTRKALQAILKAKDDNNEFVVTIIDGHSARVIAESTTKSMLTSSVCIVVQSAIEMHMPLYKLQALISEIYEEARNDQNM